MKKLLFYVGITIQFLGIIYLITSSMIVKKGPNDSQFSDMLGFTIPNVPTWVSYVPYIGYFLGLIIEQFSMHGLVNIAIMLGFVIIGGVISEKNKTI